MITTTDIMMKITSRSFHSLAGAIIAIATVSLSGTAHAAALLQNVNLGATQQTVYWEAAFADGAVSSSALSNSNMAGTPSFGTGTIVPNAPGYRAGAGYYSFSGDYAFTASTSIQGGAFSDIQNVVLQRVSMPPSSEEITPEFLQQDLTLGGGPTLTYTYLDGSQTMTGQLAATLMAVGGSLETPNGMFSGSYYNFTYQWDLSGIDHDIIGVSIDAPLMAHTSTAEVRIDIGGSYVQVVPEPASAGLAALGLAGILIRRRRH